MALSMNSMSVCLDPDLMDLVPILMETLSSELSDIENCIDKGELEFLRDKIHSSRGAALTYNFTIYSDLLLKMRERAIAGDCSGVKNILKDLKLLLVNVKFEPSV